MRVTRATLKSKTLVHQKIIDYMYMYMHMDSSNLCKEFLEALFITPENAITFLDM